MDISTHYFKIAGLICKERIQGLDDAEQELLAQWRKESASNEHAYQKLQALEVSSLCRRYDLKNVDKSWRRFMRHERRVRLWRHWGIAAACLCGIMWGLYIYESSRDERQTGFVTERIPKTVQLQLSTGELVDLERGKSKQIIDKGVVLHVDDALEYRSDSSRIVKPEYNTLIIPKGTFFYLVLGDGTKVWLNADTRLTYPVVFPEGKREVFLVGEAYFDVAKDEKYPFVVKTKQFDVQVLGTVFSVSAYEEDAKMYTALVEGLVAVSSNQGQRFIMKSGEVAEIERGNPGQIIVSSQDVGPYVAWKDGQFCFRNSSVQIILKQIERYYDVCFVYETDIVDECYTGNISRNASLQDVLSVIEASSCITFEVKRDKIYVKRKKNCQEYNYK